MCVVFISPLSVGDVSGKENIIGDDLVKDNPSNVELYDEIEVLFDFQVNNFAAPTDKTKDVIYGIFQ